MQDSTPKRLGACPAFAQFVSQKLAVFGMNAQAGTLKTISYV